MRIKLLHILTDQLKETKKFYHDILGLPVSEETPQHIHFKLKDTELGFYLSQNYKPQYHIAFNIPCNLSTEAHEWLKTRAEIIPVDEHNTIADFKNWNAKAVYFFDNNKNILELIARNDLKNEADVFNSFSIFSVSEIGIVTDHVKDTSEKLIGEYGLNYFSKQPPTKGFTAIGDDEGLFIVVANKRSWYPTNILSSKHWLKTVFIENGRTMQLELH